MMCTLLGKNLSPVDKKQVQMVQGCIQVMHKQASEGLISAEVFGKLDSFLAALNGRNFNVATSIQTVSEHNIMPIID